MMSWLKEQNRRTQEFVRGDFSSQLWMAGVAFAVLLVLGFVLGLFLKDFATTFVGFFTTTLASSGIVEEDGTIHLLHTVDAYKVVKSLINTATSTINQNA